MVCCMSLYDILDVTGRLGQLISGWNFLCVGLPVGGAFLIQPSPDPSTLSNSTVDAVIMDKSSAP